MPVTPQITLTANLTSIIGAAEPSASPFPSIQITLCGFGAFVPCVSGQGPLTDAGIPQATQQTSATPISVLLFGNDQITPAGTFYDIAIVDALGNIVQRGNYTFTGGTQTIDLSTIQPNYGGSRPPMFTGYVPLAFSLTPVFDGAQGTVFDITLTGNVASSTALNFPLGAMVQFIIQQDATGSRNFTWPSNVKNPPLVDGAANSITTANFVMRQDGNLYPPLGWS